MLSEEADRPRVLRAIKKCLSDSYDFFQDAMDELDEIGRSSVGTGMAPIIGGYAMPNPKERYRAALIKLDSAEKALKPLAVRFTDGRVNASHFTNEEAMIIMRDIIEFDYSMLVDRLSERTGRETVWYRLRELSEKVKSVFNLVAKE